MNTDGHGLRRGVANCPPPLAKGGDKLSPPFAKTQMSPKRTLNRMDKSKISLPSIFSIADEIARVDVTRPHVVIVGAGASAAAFPDGDRNGKRLPTMLDFASTLGLDAILKETGFLRHTKILREFTQQLLTIQREQLAHQI